MAAHDTHGDPWRGAPAARRVAAHSRIRSHASQRRRSLNRRRPWRQPLPSCAAEIQREQKKAEKLIKEAAKRNDLVSARVRRQPLPRRLASLSRLHARPAVACVLCHRLATRLVPPLALQILAKEVVNMRRTVTKLAMNKATFLSLSNQMTEQLGGCRQGAAGRHGAAGGACSHLLWMPPAYCARLPGWNSLGCDGA